MRLNSHLSHMSYEWGECGISLPHSMTDLSHPMWMSQMSHVNEPNVPCEWGTCPMWMNLSHPMWMSQMSCLGECDSSLPHSIWEIRHIPCEWAKCHVSYMYVRWSASRPPYVSHPWDQIVISPICHMNEVHVTFLSLPYTTHSNPMWMSHTPCVVFAWHLAHFLYGSFTWDVNEPYAN